MSKISLVKDEGGNVTEWWINKSFLNKFLFSASISRMNQHRKGIMQLEPLPQGDPVEEELYITTGQLHSPLISVTEVCHF